MLLVTEALRTHAEKRSGEVAFSFVGEIASKVRSVTYGELYVSACKKGAAWRSDFGGDARIVICTEPGPGFIEALMGCLMNGLIGVPVYPPTQRGHAERLKEVLDDCRPSAIVYDERTEDAIKSIVESKYGVAMLDVNDEGTTFAAPRNQSESGIALLQYTSGTTSRTKGVILTHGNIAHNLACIKQTFRHTRESKGVIWLPPYHDMGLIGGVLQPLYAGFETVLMSPRHFLQKPANWLNEISRVRGTISGGPNLALELCIKNISEQEMKGVRLDSWEVCFCGSEQVRVETIKRFCEKFGEFGLRHKAIMPCYGLAEATLLVTAKPYGSKPKAVGLKTVLKGSRIANFKPASTIVSCGRAPAGISVSVRIGSNNVLAKERQIGEIWVSGAGVSLGYWHDRSAKIQREKSRRRSKMGIATSDVGFILRSELYVVGRKDDIINIGGKKLSARLIELEITNGVTGLAGRRCLVHCNGEKDTPRVEVFQELPRELAIETSDLEKRIRDCVQANFGIEVSLVHLVKRSDFSVTPNGKIRRILSLERMSEKPSLSKEVENEVDGQANQVGGHLGSEDAFCALLERVIGIKGVTLDLAPASVGITSLQAIALGREIYRRTGAKVTMMDAVAAKSFREIYATIKDRKRIREAENKSTPKTRRIIRL